MSKSQFQAPKGTRDVMAPESNRISYLLSIFEDILNSGGYSQIISPIFEESTDEEIQKIKADQYDPNSETPKLLSADQIRWVLFTVNDSDGYDILAIDAAVNRLSDALEYHWRKSE